MKTVIAGMMLMITCVSSRADELNDMPDLACARASSELERVQLGCAETNLTPMRSRQETSPLDRSEDD
ncbi:hypothetical protein [Methylobacterium flocculans]|uniref:hypothetical protein n=1 Tax=Methylobacterium flocculans TaxID=2984843 RepID=UPI0021F385C4|nr:hypothetical protein [Methylobacterium sp. FF17]